MLQVLTYVKSKKCQLSYVGRPLPKYYKIFQTVPTWIV